jgi:hypothetical protein
MVVDMEQVHIGDILQILDTLELEVLAAVQVDIATVQEMVEHRVLVVAEVRV